MDELISRQAAIDALDRIFDNVPMELTTEILRLRRELRGLHAADVVPVRLGEWLDGYKMQTCSLCKCRGKKSWTFCPHCGARMIYGERKE